MSYVRRIDGTRPTPWRFGCRGAAAVRSRKPVRHALWVFTDGLVVTPTYAFSEPWFPNRVEGSRTLTRTLEPDIYGVDPTAVRLDQNRVVRVGYDGPNGSGCFDAVLRLRGRVLVNLSSFPVRKAPPWWRCCETYPGKVEDHREDLR